MSDVPLEYVRPASLGTGDLCRVLETLERVRHHQPANVRRTFLDTFDWRLFREGRVLEACGGGDRRRLLWRRLRGAALRRIETRAPRFAWDLADGSLRAELETIAEMRALAPVAWVRTRGELLELVDADDKVVCRVYLETHRTGAPNRRKATTLSPRVRVEPVRGYDKTLAAVRGALARLALQPLDADVLEEALTELAVTPSEHSTKVHVELQAELPAIEAARRIMLRLLETLEDNDTGTRADQDSEFLHDFRVAVRRTRSAIGQLEKVLPTAVAERFRAEFAWLGRVTTPTRDLDVHLLDLPRYCRCLPDDVRNDLEPLRAFLRARQRREQQVLARALSSRRYHKLRRDWLAFLTAPDAPSPDAARSGLPIAELAQKRLRKMFHRALAEGVTLGDHCGPGDFHQLRKTCKKLRYLLEFFQSLYREETVGMLVGTLKALQDNLGEFQDLHVQTGALRRWAREIETARLAGGSTQLAIGMLMEKLLTRQREVRGEFATMFAAFSDRANRERFESLFAEQQAEVDAEEAPAP